MMARLRKISRTTFAWLLLSLSGAASCGHAAENWPYWRGPRGDGSSEEKSIPVHWSSSSNVLWRVDVPGFGHASPIVWGKRIFTVSALPQSEDRALLCFDRTNGVLLWQSAVIKSPFEQKHTLNSHASS